MKADLKKDTENTRKRPIATGNRNFCATPVFAHKPLPEKLKTLSDNLINMGQGVQFANLIKENDYKYSSFYETSIAKFEKREMVIATRPTVTKILDAISTGNMIMTISPDNKIFVISHLKPTSDETFSLEA